MENYIFWSEIGSGFVELGGTPLPRIPRSTPREASVPTPRYGQYLTNAHDAITPLVVAMNSCFFLIRTQHGERSRDFETRSLPCEHPPRQLLPRRVQKHWFTRQLHCREVVAVGWEPQNSSPALGVWRWDQKN